MATQAVEQFAASSAVDSAIATNTHGKERTAVAQGAISTTADDILKSQSETENSDLGDGLLRQHIDKNGGRVLIVWSKSEEAKVVRKADFLFLPLFSVGKNMGFQNARVHCLTGRS